jgi:hypothetical protein
VNYKAKERGPPRRYPYFDAVVGPARSKDPESYAGGSVATVRVFHARQAKGDDPDKKGTPGSPGLDLGARLINPPHKKYVS